MLTDWSRTPPWGSNTKVGFKGEIDRLRKLSMKAGLLRSLWLARKMRKLAKRALLVD